MQSQSAEGADVESRDAGSNLEASALDQAFLDAGPLESDPEAVLEFVARVDAIEKPEYGTADSEEEDGFDDDAETEMDLLLTGKKCHFTEEGNLEFTSWEILRVNTRDAASEASQIFVEWSPWRSSKPTIQARVLTPDGRVIENDGALAFEQAASDGQDGVLTDEKRLTLLVNGVERGAIIESKTTHTLSPISGVAIARQFALTDFFSPARVYYVDVTSATDFEPTVIPRGTAIEELNANESDPSNRRRFWTRDPAPIFDSYESLTGPDRVSYPLILVGRPGEWKELGRSYAEVAEESIKSGSQIVKSIAASAGPDIARGSTQEKVAWAVRTIRQLVRYTGVEFGSNSIYPVPPDKVIQRRFGDCKDQACLLVSLLREFDINSHVAILSTGTALDTAVELPCLDLFDHAIAYVDDTDQWIDMTAEGYPPGFLPDTDRGRRILICDLDHGRLIETPIGLPEDHQEKQVTSYRVNFSGGGDATVSMLSKSDFAAQIRNGYEDQSPRDLVALWRDYFAGAVGSDEVRSLRRIPINDAEYKVVATSGQTQLFDREQFTTDAIWDLREILEMLPSAFLPYIDNETGEIDEVPERKLPMRIVSGFTQTYGVDVLYPGALEIDPVPENWVHEVGPIRLSGRFHVGPTDHDRSGKPELDGDELVPNFEPFESDWLSAHDQTLQVRYELTLQPGEITAEEAQECIDAIAELYQDDGRLTGIIGLHWTALKHHGSAPTDETFKRFADEAIKYRALEEPYVGLLYELAAHGAGNIARQLASEFRELPIHQSLKLAWLPALKLSNNANTGETDSDADLADLRAMMDGLELGYPEYRQQLKALVLEEGTAIHTLDEKRLRQAVDLLERIRYAETFDLLPAFDQGSILGSLVVCSLATHQDKRVARALGGVEYDMFGAVSSVLEKKSSFSYPESLSEDARIFRSRLVWEMMIAARRPELAFELQQIVASADTPLPFLITADQTFPEAADPESPESVARHALIAILSVDRKALAELLVDGDSIDRMISPSFLSEYEDWFLRMRNARTKALIETIVHLTPTKLTSIGDDAREVLFEPPVSGRFSDEKPTYTALVVRDVASGHWKLLGEEDALGAFLLDLIAASRIDSAKAILDHVAKPPQQGLLSWFGGGAPPLPPAKRLWGQLSNLDDEVRIELVARAMEATRYQDVSELDNWLSSQGLDLSPSRIGTLNEIRQPAWLFRGEFAKYHEQYLPIVQKAPTFATVERLLRIILADRNHGGELWQDERWRKLIDDYTSNIEHKDIGYSPFLRMRVEGEHQDAFEWLSQKLKTKNETPVATSCNLLLWHSLIVDEDTQTLAARLKDLEDDDLASRYQDPAYAHTLACVHARVGNTYQSLQILSDLTVQNQNSVLALDLVRALILEQIGLSDAAVKLYEATIEEAPFSDSAVIARHGIARIGQQSATKE